MARIVTEAGADRANLGGLERQTEIPTVDLDNIVEAFSLSVSELFAVADEGVSPPKPLRSGREAS